MFVLTGHRSVSNCLKKLQIIEHCSWPILSHVTAYLTKHLIVGSFLYSQESVIIVNTFLGNESICSATEQLISSYTSPSEGKNSLSCLYADHIWALLYLNTECDTVEFFYHCDIKWNQHSTASLSSTGNLSVILI